MLYLFIMVAVAAAGITRLWMQQRRMSAKLNTVDGFKQGLEALSAPKHRPEVRRQPRTAASRPVATRSLRGPQPLDPARREAAKRRIEARRRAQRVA